ncbi:DUF5018 domain-containing protein [Aridibaculum aurantiacum]|uniref:pectate lyase family protein n=1 Tax=Aridibaculum aurantiacum TaxID=2810307 RepID=UPI001A96C58E|nr:DUF5018 domain-containing protein [Aridibaculum aurantiacum]
MKSILPKLMGILICISISALPAFSQTVLFNTAFNTNSLPAGITTNGALSPTKAQDGICSQGMVQVNAGQFMQVELSSCSMLMVNMKSTSSSARTVTIRYKKDGDTDFSVATTTLSVSTAQSFNLTTLYPVLQSTVPITVRIEPVSGNIQIHDLVAHASTTLSTEANITSFKLPGQIGNEVINAAAGTVAINVPLGTPLTSVVPQSIGVSSQATISPSATTARNFTSPVAYTVTAQDGTTTKTWTVTVSEVASSAKEITAFKLSPDQLGSASINSASGTISVQMPHTAALTSIAPSIFTLSANATVSPSATAAQNFSAPVVYTVTAQDNSTKTWTVNVTKVNPDTVFTTYEAEHAEFTGAINSNHTGFTGTGFINFLSTGDNYITFSVCQRQASTQTAKFVYALATDTTRKGKLFLNDNYVGLLNFAPTTAFNDWKEEVVTLSLVAGINNIKITWDSTDGPNLDKLLLSGAACNSYTLNVTATNGGSVTVSPERASKKYFETENVTLLANSSPSLRFTHWSGDLTGTTNPIIITVPNDKNIVANFEVVPTYKLNVTVNGIGQVQLNPPGGEYAENTVVTATAVPVLGSTFTGWSGDATGNSTSTTITMNAAKNLTASFTSTYTFDFDKVVGFAATSGDNFTGPTSGGQCAADTVTINGPAEFNKLCEALYYRQQAYRNNTTVNGMKKAPLVIMLKQGIYDGTQTLSTNGAKVFGNSMLDIPEQGDLTFMGESNVTFKIGINVKRSWNLIIRNISFQDYYDDGINIGGTATHHVWVDHCTFGHPTTRPVNTEHPDGGCDVKDGASFVTISWCVFRNSWKTSLVGHSDNNGGTDAGRLKVTYINNHFLNTNSRNPRVRFGEVHVLNNLAENVGLYGIVAANSANVFAENNFFLNTRWAMYADRTVTDFKAVFGNNSDGVFTSKTGNYPAFGLKQVGNAYDDSGLPVITAQINPAMLNPGGRSVKFDELNAAAVFNPSSYYTYTPLTAEEVRVIVPMYAGADKVNFTKTCNSTLPASILAFDVKLSEGATKEAKASWTTTNEINTQRFEVERSANGRAFTAIGNAAAANTIGVNNYSFADRAPLQGISYYRLKVVDKDGKFNYSKTISINNKSSFSLAVYPNPAANNLVVTHAKATSGATLRIVTADGRTVTSLQVQQGATITNADITRLAPGNYLLILENGDNRTTTKFMKQ